MAFMAEVLSQFRLQGFLDHGFGQLLEQTVLANEVFGLFVIGQQSAEQRFRNVVFYRCHCVYEFADPSLRVMGHLHKILYTLKSEVPSACKKLVPKAKQRGAWLACRRCKRVSQRKVNAPVCAGSMPCLAPCGR